MTKKECAIVSAYTGFMIGEFLEMHRYVEELMGRPVFTHEFANKEFAKEIKNKSREDFISIEVI